MLPVVALTVAIGALVLIPTRRLYLAGWSGTALGTYFFGVLGLGLLIAELRGPARFLVPIFVLAYMAPFITGRAGVARVLRRTSGDAAARGPVVRRPNVRTLAAPPEIIDPGGTAGADARSVGPSEAAEDGPPPAEEDVRTTSGAGRGSTR